MSTKVERPIKNFLVDFGLTDKEITIYLTLLKTGPNTIMNLARETNIKRSTTHNTVEELIKKGLVSQTNYGERRMVVAEDPEKLEFLLEQKRWDMKKLEDNLPEIVKGIYEMVPAAKENSEVKVKYYKGISEIKYVYELSLSSEEVYSFANVEKYYELFPDPLGLQEKAIKNNKKRKVWDLIVESPKAREIIKKGHLNYLAKIIPANKFFSGFDLMVFDRNLAIIQLDEEEPLAILIESNHLAESFKALHQTMWQLI